MQFRKKPAVVEAIQFLYTTEGLADLHNFCGKSLGYVIKPRNAWVKAEAQICPLDDSTNTVVKHIATEGDWIIRGINGECYACKPDVFEDTYERVYSI